MAHPAGTLDVEGPLGLNLIHLSGAADYSIETTTDARAPRATFVPGERAAKLLSAGAAAAASCAMYNPLDCLRVRWQVAPRSDPAVGGGLIRYGTTIVRTEGLVDGLWRPGLTSNVMGMSLSAAVRFGYYETVRDGLVVLTSASASAAGGAEAAAPGEGGSRKSGAHMMAAGIICGALGYVWTTPFHLLKTVIQAEAGRVGSDGVLLTGARAGQRARARTFIEGALTMVREGGLRSLYRGSIPLAARGALFTSGQMMGYDGLKTYATSHGEPDTPRLHIASGVAASLGASLLSAPADLLMARYMTSPSGTGLMKCARAVYSESGLSGFWRGWPLFFVRLTPVMLTYSTLYEQFRLRMGVGYLS